MKEEFSLWYGEKTPNDLENGSDKLSAVDTHLSVLKPCMRIRCCLHLKSCTNVTFKFACENDRMGKTGI